MRLFRKLPNDCIIRTIRSEQCAAKTILVVAIRAMATDGAFSDSNRTVARSRQRRVDVNVKGRTLGSAVRFVVPD